MKLRKFCGAIVDLNRSCNHTPLPFDGPDCTCRPHAKEIENFEFVHEETCPRASYLRTIYNRYSTTRVIRMSPRCLKPRNN